MNGIICCEKQKYGCRKSFFIINLDGSGRIEYRNKLLTRYVKSGIRAELT